MTELKKIGDQQILDMSESTVGADPSETFNSDNNNQVQRNGYLEVRDNRKKQTYKGLWLNGKKQGRGK